MKTLLLLILCVALPASAQMKEMTLSLGEVKRLPIRGSNVWIQDRNILNAEGSDNALLLRGKLEGSTILKAGADTYQVQVLHPLKKESFEDFSRFIKKFVGLKVVAKDGALLLEGQLYRLQDWIDISRYAKSKYFSYQMEVTINPRLQKEMQKYFDGLLSASKLPPLTLSFEPQVEVRAKGSALIIKKYQALMKPYGISFIQDEDALQMAPTIKVQITVAEIKKSFTQK